MSAEREKNTLSDFADFNLAHPLLRAVESKGYETATPIQVDAIPHVIQGGDLVGCAQTGTGKTAAFALPTLHRLLTAGKRNPRAGQKKMIRALVLAPTRELSVQVADSFAAYGRNTKLRHCVIYGGVSQVPQVRKLREGVDTVIATPGRLLDLIEQGHVDLSNVEILIFDEADQMLDMGFIHDLRKIESHVPPNRQTLMFSATMPAEIRKLADQWLNNPINVRTAPISAPAAKVEQSVYFVARRNKIRLLELFLEKTNGGRTLLFSRTKHGADKIVKHLGKCNIRATAIHGNKSQAARKRALDQFKSQSPPVLVATDVAARGLDIKDVEHVINYDLPETPETYVHRIGRTGRAGAEGKAVSFCTSDEVNQLRSIEKLTRRKIDIAVDHLDLTTDIAPPATTAPGKSFRRGQQKAGTGRGRPGKSRNGAAAGRNKGAKPGGFSKSKGGRPAGGAAKRRQRRRPAASSKG
ncbi:MAG: DEAD/DEAH box helicase [Planctomycetales bacterium]|nr:DEAD/DEAH box helicase [Planctomycetales bacterium]